MTSLRLATAANVRAFQILSNNLDQSGSKWDTSIDREALEDEIGRFRVWSGNLGALQKGHSSLDYRLRDSPLLSSNALKFLEELQQNIDEAIAVVSGVRLPYEEQSKNQIKDEDEEDDGFFSDDEEDDEQNGAETKTELSMRFAEFVDIIDNLYKLSVRIRTPTIRSRSLKAASYRPRDADTGVDLLEVYAEYDENHIKELLRNLRHAHSDQNKDEEDFLTARLSSAITLRRRQFKYWKRHRDKLGVAAINEEQQHAPETVLQRPDGPLRNDTLEAQPEIPLLLTPKEAPSQRTAKTMLSGTEATQHHQSLDEIADAKSVTSYAATVKDINGKGVDLPPPPKAAHGDKDFECPYCYIICPARYGRGRAWRTHLLQDLQPYICTYVDCTSFEQLFRSRREWAEHEATHRKVWRCPEHAHAVYKSKEGLENHLRQQHLDKIPQDQLPTVVKVGEASTVDTRHKCPICFVPANLDGLGDFQNHIAHHLERIATFALPNGVEGDSDGASSVASRGWSGSTGSQGLTELSLLSSTAGKLDRQIGIEGISRDAHSALRAQEVGANHVQLSLENLQQIPDVSRERLDMTTRRLEELTNEMDTRYEDHEPDDQLADDSSHTEQSEDESPSEVRAHVQQHLERREAFRTYMMSFEGAENVRFYKRYGAWNGRAAFVDEAAATTAASSFNHTMFPDVRIRQTPKQMDKLKFNIVLQNKGESAEQDENPESYSVLTHSNSDKQPMYSRQSTFDTQDQEDAGSVSSVSVQYEPDNPTQDAISVESIPTLSALYRSRRLLQRDQSYAPNVSYNHIISFCRENILKLKVDAIVNSANIALKISKDSHTLNYAVHKAAGPGLIAEAKGKGRLKPGQVELTHGHNLPSTWIIHAARPQYYESKGMGQFNILTECYRSTLRMAVNYEMKTIAFPCLGTGGCCFPPRVAARIALQEVREYLDEHRDHGIQRVIFCVNSAADEKAYMDFFPVFFPPTHGDLDRARLEDYPATRAAFTSQVLEARTQVQQVRFGLHAEFARKIQEFDTRVLTSLRIVDATLVSIHEFLIGTRELKHDLSDLSLVCTVLQIACENVTETTELAKDIGGSGRSVEEIWTEYNTLLSDKHGMTFADLLMDCRSLVQSIESILIHDNAEIDDLAIIRQRLKSYSTQKKDQNPEEIRDHVDEVLHTREYTRQTVSQARDVVKLHQIRSLSKLYQLGDLEAKPTLAHPSAIFNHAVCLIREDITRLEVDVLVNSTDVSFQALGTLDRSVFKKGGFQLREDIKKFGKCVEGDVKLTPGYLLPAKHVLHTVPPLEFRKTTKDVLRKIYREVLHTAMSLKATSIAIPSIGTGMLNYPRRDCASLAMEEVKRFLESRKPSNLIEKIVFVVYSSNDEFIYKSLLPVYFPPPESTPTTASVVSSEPTIQSESTPRRTLFGSINEAIRNVRFKKHSEASRPIDTHEEHALIGFEAHAKECDICNDVDTLYTQGHHLCEIGYPLAQTLLWYMQWSEEHGIRAKPDRKGEQVALELPDDMYSRSINMLRIVEKSSKDKARRNPFVINKRFRDEGPRQAGNARILRKAEETILSPGNLARTDTGDGIKARAEVATWSDIAQRWDPVYPGECRVLIYAGRIDVRDPDNPHGNHVPLLSLALDESTTKIRHETTTQLTLSGAQRYGSVFEGSGDVLFRSSKAVESVKLYEMFRAAMSHSSEQSKIQPLAESDNPASRPQDFQVDAQLEHVRTEGSTTSYADYNRRLSDLKDRVTSVPSRKGRISPLQSRLQKLTDATAHLHPSPSAEDAQPDADNYQATSDKAETSTTQSALAHKILEYLVDDLVYRPGSYIGRHINDIAKELETSIDETFVAINELTSQNLVHNTTDANTWVVSRPPAELPVLVRRNTPDNNIAQPDSTVLPIELPLPPNTSQQVLSYMKYRKSLPEGRHSQTVRELAAALQLHTSVVWPAIRDLNAQGLIERAPNGEAWQLNPNPPHQPPFSSDRSSPNPGPSSPSRPRTATISQPLSTIDIHAFFKVFTPSATSSSSSSSAVQWSSIDKRLVDPHVLTEAGETLNSGDMFSVIVERAVTADEVRTWAERTREVRNTNASISGDDVGTLIAEGGEVWTRISKHLVSAQVLRGEGEELHESETSVVVHRQVGPQEVAKWISKSEKDKASGNVAGVVREGGAHGKEGVEEENKGLRREDKRRSAKGWRDERGEKDRRQAKLDKVLAGDMREDELRHFEDDEDR